MIDDDPTGCQTIHDVAILTTWDKNILSEVLNEEDIFFIIVNSRTLDPAKASKRIKKIALSLKLLQNEDIEYKIISRGDSTLRGHIFEELNALTEVFGPFDGTVIAPFFNEGKRITRNNKHYIKENDLLIPVSETEFAKDPFLGFKSSHIPTYLQEKTKGLWNKKKCVSIHIEDIRKGGVHGITKKLQIVKNKIAIIVNSETSDDFKIAVEGIKRTEKTGKKFLYRTGASFVQEYSGIQKKPLFVFEKPAKSCLIIAKGGNTSYDVLKFGLRVKKSSVLGQVYPGISILRLDDSCKFPGSFYVIFPGNVGTSTALTEIVKKHTNNNILYENKDK
ncbi:MAG: four-carbon acid sugar kinase family protein [Bacteroidota bacterium]